MMEVVALILLCLQLGAEASDFILTYKPIEINTSTFATNSDLPINLINNLLEKCSNKSLEDCDMCSLCQNEAFCRQKSKKPSLITSTPRLMTTLDQANMSPYNSLAYLRSQIDFTCYCVPGYTGTYCQIDINECLSTPCSNNATCIDLINAYECRCPSGYTGENCEIDINECDSSPCNPEGGQCVDLIDGYYCKCNAGFTGPSCLVNIDECASQPCMNNATCVDQINGFECNCTNTGFDGLLCENNIDDCLNVNCQHDSACIDGINSFKCDCHPGYDGKFCEIDIDECLSSPCVYGKCWQNSDRQSLARKYLLSNGSANLKEFAEQILEISLKINFNYSNSAGYWCQCEPGYTGTYCEMKIDECQSSPCGANGKCIDLINGYRCVCHPGYTGTTCTQNINECELFSPCAKNTVCIDLIPDYSKATKSGTFYLDGYYCDCSNLNNELYKKNGNRDVIYAGQNCTLKLNACQSLKSKCQHDSECQSILFNSTEQDIMCLCKPGYTGKYCEYSTVFRMDGTYFVQQQIEALNDSLSVQFEFKVNFFDRQSYPLIYFDHMGKLLYQFELHRDHIDIKNEFFGINSKIGFLYQEFDESYFSYWNLLQIKISNDFLQITYSIKQIHLNVTKLIDLRKHSEVPALRPTSFTLGKYFGSSFGLLFASDDKLGKDFTTYSLLSDACFRDFNLNMNVIFKSLKPDYLNYGFESNNKVKFGCNLRNHGILNDYQCSNEAKSYQNEGNYCENNSTCVNRWFNYECKNCILPFYGKNCNYETTRLVFANQYDMTPRHSEALLDIDFSLISSQLKENNYFQIEFNLHRFTRKNQKLSSFMNFLTLKQKISNPLVQNFYQIGLNPDGYLTLRKIQQNHDPSLNETFRLVWSLKNEKISLNQLNTSYTSLLGLKFNEQFVQLNVNQSHPVRFKLIPNLKLYSNRIEKFEISSIRFMSNFSSGHNFLIQNLVVNQISYHFRFIEPYRFELILLDEKNELIFKTMNLFKIKNVALIKMSQFGNELELIDNLQCPSAQSVTDISSNFSKKKCFESLSLRFQDSFKLSNLIKVNCELKPYASGPNNNQQYYSTCENYGVIKRRLSKKSTSASYITFFFDFDTESQEKLRAKFGPFLSANETLALINVSKQRRISLLQDIDFYSFSFDLSLSQKLQGHFTTKTNLFTLNSLDDLTSNKIFLFGLNLYISNKQGLSKYQFEIFTSKQSIKSQALELPDLVNVNLTFTFKSIELRLGHNLTHSIRLTDQYFDLFIHLLLKAYGSFQLNVNREEELRTKAQSYLGSCISNLKLLTTNDKKNFNHYDLIGQTKSIVMTKNGPSFDSTCDLEPFSSKKEILDFDLVPENCYLVTEFDVIENRNVKDNFDCQCDTVRGDCSYNFWLGFEQRNRITNRKELENEEEFHGCAESNEYACFNNGTCVDNYYTNTDNRRESYRCLCRDSYTGKRCERFDPCLKTFCSVNSTCEPKLIDNDQIGYQCKCFEGFLGRNCNIMLDQTCLGKPCKNGATCINITSYDEESLSYECMCALGYEGKQCDKKIDYCYLYQPCKNGAICSNKEMTNNSQLYECKCTEGWKGINCTQDIDECADMDTQKTVQCSGNGYCINIPGSYKCKCSDLFFGKNCELAHACQDSELPCKNGGICIVVGNIEENKYSCRCPLGYAGINCSFKTCDSKPCEHDSICSMENATSFKCNCTNTGFAGQRCENLIDYAECRQQTCFGNMTCDLNRCDCNSIDCEKIFLQMKSRPREIVYHLVIWPLLVIMVSLLIILFSIFAMRIKKSRATRGTYSPSRHEQQASRIEFNMDLKIPPEERLI